MPRADRPSRPSAVELGGRTPRRLLVAVGALTLMVLALSAPGLFFDSNFYTLWEATALLAGDHPHRDFFEWGMPLQMMTSVVGQVISGHRLIGEFGLHWLFILAGALISAHLGYRLSGSVAATLATALVSLILLGNTPTFHYPKLFFYPLGVWVIWRYLDRPAPRRGAVVGLVTALAFLFRHDHGLYIGAFAVLAFIVARVAHPVSRTPRSMLRDIGGFCGVSLAILVPWVVFVHANEGFPEYVRARHNLYRQWEAAAYPHRVLVGMNPVALFTPTPAPPPRSGEVVFRWERVDEPRQRELEASLGLERLSEPDEERRVRFDSPNIYDVRLNDIRPLISNTDGIPWDEVEQIGSRMPAREAAERWTMQMATLVPLLLLAAAVARIVAARRRHEPVGHDGYLAVAAALFLTAIDSKLFREPGYVVVVAPLTAALAAPLVSGFRRHGAGAAGPRQPARGWTIARVTVATLLLLINVVTAYAYTRRAPLFTPVVEDLVKAKQDLLVSPAIDGYAAAASVLAITREQWDAEEAGNGRVLLRYLHDCTRAGDRILVTGSTPYHVSSYVDRPIAGGHLLWHHAWLSEPDQEAKSLALLKRQSVPFAVATHDPIAYDLQRYPSVLAYFQQHYTALPGSHGKLLYDARRQPTGTYGALGFPCFK